MKSLRHGLKTVRGVDNPPIDSQRYLDMVRKVKTVYELKVQIKKRNEQLCRINEEIDFPTQKKTGYFR